jgi:D-alanyl-D-alanine carboxypeptidase/D-alanyl-D-alanine-endopeptidase (penicillin-binding protein 4)
MIPLVTHLLLLLFWAQVGVAQSFQEQITPYLKNGAVLVATDDEILFEYQTQPRFKVASLLKYANALAAFHHFGPRYQFKTEIYLTPESDLIIRGYGDPFLISEELDLMIRQIIESKQLLSPVRHILLDDSAFAPNLVIPGLGDSLNPYDASNGALIANFNTIHVEVLPSGKVISAEPQTPLTPLAQKKAHSLKTGVHRINISQNPQDGFDYIGELIVAFLQKYGVSIQGEVQRGKVTPASKLLVTYQSQTPLKQVVQSMMIYSNNFIANQLLLKMGMDHYGEPATLEKGVKVLNLFLTQTMETPSDLFQVTEGSGLSRQNEVSPSVVLRWLRAFKKHYQLLPIQDKIFVKTGTLKGVYNIAGYLPHPDGMRYFVIMLNQPRNHRNQIFSLIVETFQRQQQ